MRELRVFDDVSIPVDYASTQTYALLAKRDGGKTYTTLLFEEQLCDAGLFFVTLDPVGKHWALRAGADGSERGGKRDVWVLGGSHGDVPLEPSSGEVIADVVVDHPGRYVLDVSGFETDAEQDRFALAFGKRLFRRKQRDQSFPLTLILEEAESFIPERPQPGQQPMLGAYGRIMRQGRNYGLGMWMVAQRAQALNKGVLSQAEVLVVKQMAHPRDRGAVDDWIKANGTPEQREELMGSIASLEQNEAFVWSPAWLRVFKRTRVPARMTFDSSASVKGGQEARTVELVPLDVEKLGVQIAKTAERAKSDDPKELRKRIQELERQVGTPVPSKPVEVPVDRIPEWLPGRVVDIQGMIRHLTKQMPLLAAQLAELRTDIESFEPAREVASPVRIDRPSPPPVPEPAARNGGAEPGRVSRPQQAILDALASLDHIGVPAPSRIQLALFAEQSPSSSGYEKNLSTLRTAGLVDYPYQGAVALTADGRARADASSAPSTTAELLAYVRRLVRETKWQLIDVLVGVYPNPLSREDLAERAGASSSSSGYEKNLSTLRTLGLIDYPQRGFVVARPVLFLGEDR